MKCNKCDAYHHPKEECPPDVSEKQLCTICWKYFFDVERHVANDECEVVNDAINDIITGKVTMQTMKETGEQEASVRTCT